MVFDEGFFLGKSFAFWEQLLLRFKWHYAKCGVWGIPPSGFEIVKFYNLHDLYYVVTLFLDDIYF